MKRLFALLAALCLSALLCAALAEEAPAPLLRLYQAERTLLFDTDNVTMTGHASFTMDGKVFKVADLLHVQDGIASIRDWQVSSPWPVGDGLKTGYTVVTQGSSIDAFESYERTHKHYSIEPKRQRSGILRRTVAGDTLADLAELLLTQCGEIGEATVAPAEDGSTELTLHLTGAELPPVLNSLLNSVLQYGIDRYTGHDYAADQAVSEASYNHFVTVSEGLVFCLKSVSLRELTVSAVLDAQCRLQSARCNVALTYEEKSGRTGELCAELEQTVSDYGASCVNSDPWTYDHWGAADRLQSAADTPVIDRSMALENALLLLNGLCRNPNGGARLHADPNCPSVSGKYLPMGKAEITPDLLLECGLCPFCVDVSAFDNEVGEPSADAAAAAMMARLSFDADHGMLDLYNSLLDKYGPFSTWSYAQKHYFTGMLPTLSMYEEERVRQYHPDWLPNTNLQEILGVWCYGLPKGGADAAVKEAAAACAIDAGLVTREQLDAFTVSCAYYTASSFALPFAQPWWVVRYADKTQPVCEVWVNSALDSIHAVDVQRMAAIAQEALAAHGPVLAGTAVPAAALSGFDHYIVYLPDEAQWLYVFDSGADSCWTVYLQDNADLTVVLVDSSNG